MGNKIRRAVALGFQALLVAPLLFAAFPSDIVRAAGEPTFTGTNALSAVRGTPSAVGLQLTAGDMTQTVPVTLSVSQGFLTISPASGVTLSSGTAGTTLGLSGTITNLNTALATLKYTPTSGASDTLEASLSSQGDVFFPGNGHIYEFVRYQSDWVTARAQAALRTRNGAQGYLATITSQAENDYVASRLEAAGWMGASDMDNEGEWKWVEGPENGTQFWSGDESEGYAVDGEYEEWADGEPNNAGDEDCTQYLSGGNGEWNDLPCENTLLPGYVVEYGAPGDLPYQTSKSVAITNTNSTSVITISDCQQLQTLRFDLDANYVMTHDIDCTETKDWNSGKGWIPAGDGGAPFTGSFNGNGHKITGLYLQDDNRSRSGLFGQTDGASISNLTLDDAWFRGATYTGGIVGRAVGTTLTNVHFNGTAWARLSQYGGGLVGHGESLSITNSSTSGFVHGSGTIIGGLVGYLYSGTITDSHSASDVDGGTSIGGAIGEMDGGTITNVYATGSVDVNTDEDFKAGTNGGGFVGTMGGGTITKSYATGDVKIDVSTGGGFVGFLYNDSAISESYATGSVDAYRGGGFVGVISDDATIENAYAWGNITGSSAIGGFAGVLNSSDTSIDKTYAKGQVDDVSDAGGYIGATTDTERVTNSFWDKETSGQEASGNASPLTSNDMKKASTFTSLSTDGLDEIWDKDIWVLRNGYYPVLRAFYTPSSDEDGDGIADTSEDAAPNNGDANNDGILDSKQSNVSAYVNSATNSYAVLEAPEACNIASVSQKTESSLLATDSGYKYPLGLMDFTIECGTPGYTATIKQYYYGAAAQNFVARKYNSANHSYAAIPGASITTATTGGQQVVAVTYQLTDGGDLDQDSTTNGTIVDPAGLAVNNVKAPNTGLGGTKR